MGPAHGVARQVSIIAPRGRDCPSTFFEQTVCAEPQKVSGHDSTALASWIASGTRHRQGGWIVAFPVTSPYRIGHMEFEVQPNSYQLFCLERVPGQLGVVATALADGNLIDSRTKIWTNQICSFKRSITEPGLPAFAFSGQIYQKNAAGAWRLNRLPIIEFLLQNGHIMGVPARERLIDFGFNAPRPNSARLQLLGAGNGLGAGSLGYLSRLMKR